MTGALIVWDVAEDAVSGTLDQGTEIAYYPQPYHPPFFRSADGRPNVDRCNRKFAVARHSHSR